VSTTVPFGGLRTNQAFWQKAKRDEMSKYHSGELAVQKLAGVQAQASRMSGSFYSELPAAARQFVEERNFAAITWHDQSKRLWITPLSGQSGFLRVRDEQTLECDLTNCAAPLLQSRNFANDPVALVLMDFAGRRRMRVIGEANCQDKLIVTVNRAYGNCPKYIQKREPAESLEDGTGVTTAQKSEDKSYLDEKMQALINSADTFFIGSYAAEGGADASHRGGAPGFVSADEHTVRWTDYPGNNMFNTLGNIQASRETALLFLDFETGAGLALNGNIETFMPSVAGQPAAKETAFKVENAKFLPRALALSWNLVEYSPFN